MSSHRHRLLLLLVTGLFLLVTFISQQSFEVVRSPNKPLPVDTYTVWPAFVAAPARTHDWYQQACFENSFGKDFEEILTFSLSKWSSSSVAECSDLFSKFSRIYEVRERFSSKMVIPNLLSKKIHEWMKGDAKLIADLQKQHLIHVFNRFTSDHCIYNPSRSNRPLPTRNVDILRWIDDLSEESKKNCDFCQYDSLTAVDQFGRHETEHTVRASNAFKMERWHGMVITKSHHPINISKDTFLQIFHESDSWANEVFQLEQEHRYPSLSWDTLPHAGVSQIHPHLQLMLAPGHYYGYMESLRRAAQSFYDSTKVNYFTTLVEVHNALGLAVTHGSAIALATLSGPLDLEIMLLSEEMGPDLFELLHLAVTAFHQSFQQYCYSMSMVWPALGTTVDKGRGRMPAILLLTGRGNCVSERNDVSSFEIYGATYRARDPWQVRDALVKAIQENT